MDNFIFKKINFKNNQHKCNDTDISGDTSGMVSDEDTYYNRRVRQRGE